MTETKQIKVYLNSNKEQMGEYADELGLTGKAYSFFLFGCYEVCLLCDVDMDTGACNPVKILTGEDTK